MIIFIKPAVIEFANFALSNLRAGCRSEGMIFKLPGFRAAAVAAPTGMLLSIIRKPIHKFTMVGGTDIAITHAAYFADGRLQASSSAAGMILILYILATNRAESGMLGRISVKPISKFAMVGCAQITVRRITYFTYSRFYTGSHTAGMVLILYILAAINAGSDMLVRIIEIPIAKFAVVGDAVIAVILITYIADCQ